MSKPSRLPERYPIGTKYVVEGRGPFVRRFIEFPDGRRVSLSPRKAATCVCADRRADGDDATLIEQVAA